MRERPAIGIAPFVLPDDHCALPGAAFDAITLGATVAPAAASAWHDVFAVSGRRFVLVLGEAADPPAMDALRESLRVHFALVGGGDIRSALRSAEPLVQTSGAALVALLDPAARTVSFLGRGDGALCLRYRDGDVVALPADCTSPTSDERIQPAALTTLDLRGVELVLFASGGFADAPAGATSATELTPLLAESDVSTAAQPAARIAARLGSGIRGRERALVAVTLPSESGVPLADPMKPRWSIGWSFEAAADASRAVRLAYVARLASKAVGRVPIDLMLAELIFGELLGNVVRHAPGHVEIVLDWTGDYPVLHVKDDGPGFYSRRRRERLPADDLSEGGRGLFIVNSCALNFSIRGRRSGGTHAIATLPAAAPIDGEHLKTAASPAE